MLLPLTGLYFTCRRGTQSRGLACSCSAVGFSPFPGPGSLFRCDIFPRPRRAGDIIRCWAGWGARWMVRSFDGSRFSLRFKKEMCKEEGSGIVHLSSPGTEPWNIRRGDHHLPRLSRRHHIGTTALTVSRFQASLRRLPTYTAQSFPGIEDFRDVISN
jgi:hypothetical protein